MTLDDLIAYGANVEEGLERCVGNEELYLRLVTMTREDKNFEALAEALKENDLEKAFSAAHALKGVLGNLSLTPLYEPICEMVELLRVRTEMDYSEMMDRISQARDALCAL